MIPITVNITDAAAMIGVCERTIRDWINSGDLPIVKFPSVEYAGEKGRRIYILVSDLQAFAEKHREVTT